MNKTLLKIAAAYIRVSDERQDEYSPDSQLKKTREYAAKEGYLIPDEYVFYDDGISAKSTKKRAEFNRMIAMAKSKEHPFDVIYVWKFSRFARNQEESMVYKNLLRKKNVAVVSVSEPIPEGHYGTLIERIIEWMDEFYLINLSAEVTRGMTEKATRGEPLCPPPMGYIMKDKKYYPDDNGGADIIREIFDRYNNGEGMRSIATALGARGVRTKRGNPPDNRWVEYILRNPCYIGKIRWSLDGTKAASKRDYSNESILITEGHHEPIITQEQWDKAQTRLDETKRIYPKYAKREQPVEYMLKGLVRCSSCGGTLACSSTKSGKAQNLNFQCCNYARGSCRTSHAIVMYKIENALINALEASIGNHTFAISPERKKENTDKNLPDFDKLIAIEERKLTRASEAYLSEIYSLEQFASMKKDIETRIKELKKLQDEQTVTPVIDPCAYAKKVTDVLNFIKREDVTPSAKNEALHTIIDKIIYEKAKNNLAIYFIP